MRTRSRSARRAVVVSAAVVSLCSMSRLAPVAAQDGLPYQGARLPVDGTAFDAAAGDLDGDGRAELVVTTEGPDGLAVFANGSSGPPVVFPLGGTSPRGVALADVDGDGLLDAVTANAGSGDLTVLCGLPGAAFGPPTLVPVGAGAEVVAVGDVTGDGLLDLVAGSVSGAAFVAPGTGGGRFDAAVPVAVGNALVGDLALAHVDGDDALDLVALAGTTVHVLLGDGLGGFAPSASFPGGAGIRRLAVADVTGDGNADVLLARCGLGLARGQGDGTFAAPEVLVAEGCGFPIPQRTAVLVDDWSADGVPDLVVSNTQGADVLLGEGLGGGAFAFQPLSELLPGNFLVGSATELVAADLLGDGTTTVVAVNSFSTADVLLLRVSPGADPGVSLSTAGASAAFVAVGDLTGDGAPDVVTADQTVLSTSGAVRLHPNDGVGGLLPADQLFTGEMQAVLVERIDDDALPDLLTMSFSTFDFTSRISVSYGDGAGGFAGGDTVPLGEFGAGPRLSDLDADGWPDIVVFGEDSLLSILADGTGQFGSPVPLGFEVDNLALGTLDGDVFPSLMSVTDGDVARRAGVGDGTFGAPTSVALPQPGLHLLLADLDADGREDLLVSQEDDGVAVLLGLPAGGLAAPLVTPWPRAGAMAVGHVDGDGHLDLLVDALDPFVMFGDGRGGFDGVLGLSLSRDASRGTLHLADMDGDGLDEVVGSVGQLPADALVLPNGPGRPWVGLHGGLAGRAGVPRLAGEGSLAPAAATVLSLRDARAEAPVALVLGASELSAPFGGGVLVPAPDVVRLVFSDAAGTARVAFHWPGAAPGTDFWWQAWVLDGDAMEGVAGSNALRTTTP